MLTFVTSGTWWCTSKHGSATVTHESDPASPKPHHFPPYIQWDDRPVPGQWKPTQQYVLIISLLRISPFLFFQQQRARPHSGLYQVFASVILKGSIEEQRVKLDINRGGPRGTDKTLYPGSAWKRLWLIFLLTAFDDASWHGSFWLHQRKDLCCL